MQWLEGSKRSACRASAPLRAKAGARVCTRVWTRVCARLLPGLLGVMLCAAQAQTVRTLQPAPLRSARAADAAALVALPAEARVDLLQLSGGWAEVQLPAPEPVRGQPRAPGLRGWLRASSLDLHTTEVALASQIETGRRAGNANAVTLGSRAFPPRSNRHALIIGLGHYQQDPARRVADLEGLGADMASALSMARSLQVPDANITLLRDDAATSAGIEAAITALAERTQPGDRVFIYWSGHGSRYFDAGAGGCVETLLPYDLQDVTNRQLAQWLRPIGAKADKLMVLYDACHSAGIAPAATAGPATRALGSALQAKFTPGPDTCNVPSNVRTRSLGAAAAALGLTGQDVVHISSSRPDELSLQDPTRGGLATAAFRECLQGDARDADGSGSISVQELADCAQAKVDAALVGNPRFRAPHLVLSGNREFVPAWFSAPAAAGAVTVPPAGAPSAVPAPTLSPLAVATAPDNTAPAVPLSRVLEQIHGQRDGKRNVTVTATPERLRIGADALGLRITASHAGHVYVAMLGSDGESLYLLFPNQLDGANRIEPGQTLALPRSRWAVKAGGPPGQNQLLVVVSDGARDLAALGGSAAGPFVKALTDAQGRAQLQWLMGTSAQAKNAAAPCAGGACSDAFGSALISVEEY